MLIDSLDTCAINNICKCTLLGKDDQQKPYGKVIRSLAISIRFEINIYVQINARW